MLTKFKDRSHLIFVSLSFTKMILINVMFGKKLIIMKMIFDSRWVALLLWSGRDNGSRLKLWRLRFKLLELFFNKLIENVKTIFFTKPIQNSGFDQIFHIKWSLKFVTHPTTRIYCLFEIFRKPTWFDYLLSWRNGWIYVERCVCKRFNSNLHR